MGKSKLFDAASSNDVKTLSTLLKKDPFILIKVSFSCINKTPLHIAAMKGHLEFVEAVISTNPELAEVLDSQQLSPLHEASSKGFVDVVRILLLAAPDMCLSRDCQGKNPLHLAVMKGQVPVLTELVRACPIAAQERVDYGQTILHLCFRHDRLECLMILEKILSDQILNAKDDDGNTVMHLVVSDRHIQFMKYLVETNRIDMSITNSQGLTAIEILEKDEEDDMKSDIRKILRPALRKSTIYKAQPAKWLTKKRDSIMVVAILIATMAFQAGLSPPGGVWQENSNAGVSIMSYRHPKFFKNFLRANTVAFVSSLSIILLLISGLPFRRKFFMWFLMIIMWLTISSIAVTYGLSIAALTPEKDFKSMSHVIKTGIFVWCSVMGIMFIGNSFRLFNKCMARGIHICKRQRFMKKFQFRIKDTNQEPV